MQGDVVVGAGRRWLAWGAGFVAVCMSAATGCQPGEDVGAGVSSDALEERMNVISEGPNGERIETTRVDFAQLLGSNCAARRDAHGAPLAGVCASGPACMQRLCTADVELCMANELLSFSRIVAPEHLSSGQDLPATIPPQSPATNAGLANLAGAISQRAAYDAALALYLHRLDASGTCLPAELPLPDDDPISTQVFAANIMTEAFQLATGEARETMGEYTTAVADAYFSGEAQIRDATELAHVAPLLSRAWYAHSILGGTAGLPAVQEVSEEGFCSEPRLSPDAERALQLLRVGAPPPAVVLDVEGVTLEQLWTGAGWPALSLPPGAPAPSPQNGSLRGRLSILLAAPHLASATPAQIYERFGLSESAFMEARAHLARELRAFGRDADQLLPAEALRADVTTDTLGVVLYAATRNPPSPPLPAYFAAVTGYDAAGATSTPAPAWPGPYHGTFSGGIFASTAHFTDIFASVLTELVIPDLVVGTPIAPLSEAALNVIAGTASDASRQREGRVQVCHAGGTSEVVDVRVWGHWLDRTDNPQEHLVVRGHAGLQCAVRGAVEGAPCALEDFIVEATQTVTATDVGRIEGFSRRLRLQVNSPSSLTTDPMLADDGALLFVVRPRPGGAIAGRHPGAYVSVAGFFAPRPAPGAPVGQRCQTVVVAPELEAAAADAIAPSTTYCALSAMNCAGLPLDQRVPLENELTEDFDPVESSWRRYLTLARNQADEADRLGEDLIRAGLEQDVRAEQAIDELENLCGVSINIEALSDPMSAMNETGAACSPLAPCSSGYRCVNEACMPDPVEIALASAATDDDRARLVACLGDSSVVPWVTVGSSPLCMWWDGSDPSTICEGADAAHSCPFEGTVPTAVPGDEPEVVCAMAKIPDDPTGTPYTPIEVPYALRFFTADPEEPPPPLGMAPCEALARLRAAPDGGGQDAIDAVMTSPYLSLVSLEGVAGRLNWRPAPGDFSTVTYDDIPLVSTGSHLTGAGLRWPYGPRPWADQCPDGVAAVTDPAAGNPPLFCMDLSGDLGPDPTAPTADPLDPAIRFRRAQMNDLLARAVLAARVVTGRSVRGMYFPYYARSQDEVLEISEDGGRWQNPVRFDGETVLSSRGAQLRIANPSDVFGSDDTYELFDMNRATAYRVPGPATPDEGPAGCSAIPRFAEWASCPWDLGLGSRCVEIFDDAPDCDDDRATNGSTRRLADRDVAMIVRSYGDGREGDAVASTAVDLWRRASERGGEAAGFIGRIEQILARQRAATADGDPARYARSIAFSPATGGIEQLTRYWGRSQCGSVDHHNCGGSTFYEMDERARNTVSCFSGDPDLPGNGVACFGAIGCEGRYAGCFSNAEEHGIDFPETFDGNRAFIAPRGLTDRDVLNGLELMCAASRVGTPGGSRCDQPPTIESVGDLFAASEHLDCLAAEIETSASRIVLRDMPRRSVELLQRGGGGGVYGGVSGEYAAAVGDLRAALIDVSDLSETMALITRQMAAEIRAVRADVGRFDIQREIADWRLVSTVADQLTACAVTAAQITSVGTGFAAGFACTNTGIQIGVATRITDLEQEDTRLGVAAAFARFEGNYAVQVRSLAGTQTQLRSAFERIDAARTRIVDLQRRGRRALSRALFLDADETGRQLPVNTVMRRRQNTLAIRYREAHRRAIRMAYLAKRALEQRLGMPMDRMTDPLPLLDEPPADWHMDVCSMTGIDYDRIRRASPGATGEREGDDSALDVPTNYAGEYVGDYVRRLEAVFESYSLAFPFQDGTDTAVLSMRDELWGVRAMCSADVPNLLYEAGHLDAAPSTDGTRVGWSADGCVSYDAWPPDGGADAPPQPNCATANAIDEPSMVITPADGPSPVTGPIPPTAADFGRVGAFRVEFGDPTPRAYPDGTPVMDGAGGLATAITPDTALTQWTQLDAGRYRVSYYARQPIDDAGATLSEGVAPEAAVRAFRGVLVAGPGGGLVDAVEPMALSPATPLLYAEDAYNGWNRYYFFIDVPGTSPIGVAVVPSYGATPTYRVADVAAIMLENVTGRVTRDPNSPATDPAGAITTVAATHPPAPFFDTGQARTRELEVCEDTTGSTFRRRAWTRGCARLCPDGYGGECSALAAETHCYYQTSFTLDPEHLERAGLLGGGGLAFGNFNYRVDRLAVNLVGTNLRDCSDISGSTASTCYASGNIAYSVVHQGPYWVRNHTGGLYAAPLFTGRIERARAVAAERYVTNPLSSADRALIEPYARTEFRGRPMPGTYLLRVWDDPSFRFDRLEDVQIVLDYRYWTRQE